MPQLQSKHPADAHDRVIGLGNPETQLPLQRHRGGHVAGVGLQAKDMEAEVKSGLGGGDHEVPAYAKAAGFGGAVQSLQLAHAGIQPMHADDARRFPVDRRHQQPAARGFVEVFEVGQLAQGGGLDGGKFAAYKLLQPPAVPCQKRPSCIEVVGNDAFMMFIVAWFIL